MPDWSLYPNFSREEFDSPDVPGSGNNMHPDFLLRLQRLRNRCRFPFHINSGFRTPEHNAAIGGASNSAHTRGRAADIACTDSRQRYALIYGAEAVGFRRIGIAKTFIHLDDDPTLPAEVAWTY